MRKIIRNPYDAIPHLKEVEGEAYINGNTRVILGGNDPIGLDSSYDYPRAFRMATAMGGAATSAASRIIPRGSVGLLTPYNGTYVPVEYQGFAVELPTETSIPLSPISRVLSSLMDQDLGEPKTSFRYYPQIEIVADNPELNEKLSIDPAMCLAAVARAIYDVTNGVGQTDAQAYINFETMLGFDSPK